MHLGSHSYLGKNEKKCAKLLQKNTRVVKEMQLAFKCSSYSAEFVVAHCCGVTSRYIRFAKISKSETDHIKALMNDFQGVYNAQKGKAKNKPYDPASLKPLEGRWEEKNRFGLGKVTHRWLFNRTESADAFRSQYECNFHTIACAFTPIRKLSYYLEGNLVLADDATSIATEIFRINGNDNSVAYYRVGCYQIWKVEGSTCMQFNFEGNFVSENDMISTSFWSSQDPMKVYSKVHRMGISCISKKVIKLVTAIAGGTGEYVGSIGEVTITDFFKPSDNLFEALFEVCIVKRE